MTAQGSAATRYRRALEMRSTFLAELAAREMRHLTLTDALGLLTLYAAEGSPKYEKAAGRWLARLVGEQPHLSLGDVQLAAAALEALPARGETAVRVLAELAR